MSYKVVNNSNRDLSNVIGLIENFFPYAQKAMGFNKPVNMFFESDLENAKNLLGKTAFYDPQSFEITIYVDDRHPKDIMRSLSHELVHHTQNCNGEFSTHEATEEGYAQKDPHLRQMEEDAYKRGNLTFRDWEDTYKSNLMEKKTMDLNEKTLKDIIQDVIQEIMSEKTEEIEELTGGQKQIAKAAPPEDKITGEDFAALKKKKKVDEEVDEELEEGGAADRPESAGKHIDAPDRGKRVNEDSVDNSDEEEALEEATEESEESESLEEEEETESDSEPLNEWWDRSLYERLINKWTK